MIIHKSNNAPADPDDRDYDVHGPAGPTAFWKLSDELLDDRNAGHESVPRQLPYLWEWNNEESSDDDDEDDDESSDGDDEGEDEAGNTDAAEVVLEMPTVVSPPATAQ